MRKFHPLKNVLTFTSVLLFFSLSGPANAAETDAQNSTSTGHTQQPVIIPLQPETDTETETETNDITLEEDDKLSVQPVELAVEPTPQPPLIDAQPEPKYEPDTNDSSVDEKIEQATQQPAEPPVEATPQPPLIDAQPAPSYEPDTADSAIEPSDLTSTTQTPVPLTVQPINAESIDTEDQESEKDEQQETKSIEQSTKWSDTRPALVSADWVQLKSGEWLRGRIIAMQEDDLEFESDELKKLVIEWKKVRYIKSSAPYRLRFDDQVQAIGAIEITQKEVHVTTDYDDLTFDRKKLLTIASGKETEISLWTSKVTFSINVRRGNTDQTDFTSKITAKRQTILSRLVLDYLGNFTAIDKNETINNHRLNGIYNIFITRKMFLPLISAEYFRDPFQNIEQRVYVGTGIGYTLIKTNKSEWQVTGGPAYQATEFASVQPDQAQKDSTFTLILSTKFDFELNSKVDLEGSYTATLGDEATGNYSHHSTFTVETELTDDLDLDTSLVWDRTRQPVAEANGDIPEQDDFRFLVGLGYDL